MVELPTVSRISSDGHRRSDGWAAYTKKASRSDGWPAGHPRDPHFARKAGRACRCVGLSRSLGCASRQAVPPLRTQERHRCIRTSRRSGSWAGNLINPLVTCSSSSTVPPIADNAPLACEPDSPSSSSSIPRSMTTGSTRSRSTSQSSSTNSSRQATSPASPPQARSHRLPKRLPASSSAVHVDIHPSRPSCASLSHRAYPPSQSQQIRQDTWFNLGLAAMCGEDNASTDRL